jgi:hypothetical protein
MPTNSYGGQGAPHYNEGEFTVKYSLQTAEGSRLDVKEVFTEYDKAKAFYNSIDDSAALWDNTGIPELCEGKNRAGH